MSTKTRFFQNCLGVFQGGGCRGPAFVGAFKESMDRGVSFSEVVGTSAGSIVAAFIAAGATPQKLNEIIKRLNFTTLLAEPQKVAGYNGPGIGKILKPVNRDLHRIVMRLGMYDSSPLQKWVDDELKALLQKQTSVKFRDLKIPTTIVVSDLKSKAVKLYGNKYNEDEYVAEAVRYSCNIPIFFQPVLKRFIDGGLLSNLPTFIFQQEQNSTFERVLAFTLESNINENEEITSIKDFLGKLTDTAIDGSTRLQMQLQKNIHAIVINTGSIGATDFDKMDEAKVDILIENGIAAAKSFFDNEVANIKSQTQRQDVYLDYFKAYNEIANSNHSKVEEVIISDQNTEWVYDLFPTLLGWVMNKAKVTVIKKHNNGDPRHEAFRRRLLEHFGCEYSEQPDLPMRGIVINGAQLSQHSFALVYTEVGSSAPYHSKLYHGEEDFAVIALLREKAKAGLNFSFTMPPVTIVSVSDQILFRELRNVAQYKAGSVHFKTMEIEVSEVIFLTKYVRGFKIRQIEQLFDKLRRNNVTPFVPAVLHFPNGKRSMFAPPILEEIGGKYYVIEGNTRLTYAYKNGIEKLTCVVVSGVAEPLPSSGRFRADEILITDMVKIGDDRYDGFSYGHFRKIESAVRNPDTTLL